MKLIGLLVVIGLAAGIGACGASNSSAELGAGANASKEAPARSGNASAEEVARESRGDLRCPARVGSGQGESK